MDYVKDVTIFILKGSITTIELYAVTALFSIPIALIIALVKVSGIKTLKFAADIYTWILRGTPLMLQVFFVYFGLPVLGIRFEPFIAASLAFILNYSAYLSEIIRAGIQSIDKGQYEAARVLGMNYRQTMLIIILPQTIRRIIPPTSNEAINLVKDTALVAAIGMPDLLRAAKEAVTRDFTISPFIIAAVIYLLLTSVIVIIFNKLEKDRSLYE
ncbi:MAG: amino acid ABC transporter permease [Clostridiales bacterium]|nr:amino acid ABC transporter permease [Clostridiales bacterium]HBM80295.1 amino acid ABC transporter permease [Clostridiaceae bacterium]